MPSPLRLPYKTPAPRSRGRSTCGTTCRRHPGVRRHRGSSRRPYRTPRTPIRPPDPSWVGREVTRLDNGRQVWLLVGVPLLVLAVSGRLGPELWSMFAFYRGKLRIAYALHRPASPTGQPPRAVAYVNDGDAAVGETGVVEREPSLAGLVAAGGSATPLTICASATATTRGVKTHYGIPALSFTFTSEQVGTYVPVDDLGHYRTVSCATADLEKAYRGAGGATTKRITTMFAVALAGAAVAPAMGRFRIGPTSMLITFANIRLGAWLPNPRLVAQEKGREFPRVGLGYLAKEFFGIHDPSDPYVYVSDGGHWENAGLVELLRTAMPREVICVDAEAGSPAFVDQLAQAIDLAKLECGVDVLVDLDPLRGGDRCGFSDSEVVNGPGTPSAQPLICGMSFAMVDQTTAWSVALSWCVSRLYVLETYHIEAPQTSCRSTGQCLSRASGPADGSRRGGEVGASNALESMPDVRVIGFESLAHARDAFSQLDDESMARRPRRAVS